MSKNTYAGANYKLNHPHLKFIPQIDNGLSSNEIPPKSVIALEDKISESNFEIKKLYDLITDLTAKTARLEKETTGFTNNLNKINKDLSNNFLSHRIELDEKISTIFKYKYELTTDINNINIDNVKLNNRINSVDKTTSDLINTINETNNQFKERLTTVENYHNRILALESILQPIHESYMAVMNILNYACCGMSNLTGNTVEYTEDFS